MPTPVAQPVLLIANRGEIAIRIARAACELGWRTVGLVAQDDQDAQHACHMDAVQVLPGKGVPAYLHIAQVVEAALAQGCTHVHPGYGLLSENADFARACAAAGLVFVGPSPEVLDLLGDKAQARALARRCRVPVTDGIDSAVTLAQAQAFFAQLAEHSTQPAMMIKALAGGGGRGMRIVEQAEDIAPSFARCQSEALAALGRGDLYVEQLVRRARHMTLADDLRMERDLVRHCFHTGHLQRSGASSETVEGIRALAIDKDHAPRWNPGRIEDVTPDMVAPFFQSPWPRHAHPLAALS